jgi:hypothetical protein
LFLFPDFLHPTKVADLCNRSTTFVVQYPLGRKMLMALHLSVFEACISTT